MPDHHSPPWPLKIRAGFQPRPGITHAVFDFDGTLSWLRHGWPRMMYEMWRELLPPVCTDTDDALEQLLYGDIYGLNGKPTIHQMRRFAERVRARNGEALDPEAMRAEYQRRLDLAIAERTAEIQSARVAPEAYVVHGARRFLELLQARGIKLHILSGTIVERVREEARLLELEPFFGPRIFGSGSDPAQFSKQAVIDRILREEGIPGHQLLSLGDGAVELDCVRQVGGVGVAVCTHEDVNGSPHADPYKQQFLDLAGPQVMIPHFGESEQLARLLLG
jgi:phosphoglycolate phosphatase-like HAD superfamily hydrolase